MIIPFMALLAVAALAAAACAVCWKVAFRDGLEAGLLQERSARAEGKIRQRAEDEHWDNYLRRLGTHPRAPWDGETWELAIPASESGVALELAARADAFIAQLAAEEEAFRQEITS